MREKQQWFITKTRNKETISRTHNTNYIPFLNMSLLLRSSTCHATMQLKHYWFQLGFDHDTIRVDEFGDTTLHGRTALRHTTALLVAHLQVVLIVKSTTKSRPKYTNTHRYLFDAVSEEFMNKLKFLLTNTCRTTDETSFDSNEEHIVFHNDIIYLPISLSLCVCML